MENVVIKLSARIACLALSLTSIPVAASQQTWPTRDFFLNDQGGVNQCVKSAATDGQVEWCAGDLPPSSRYNPARFNCREAEVDSEYMYCGKPFPKRRK
jgi:hypothetical protein